MDSLCQSAKERMALLDQKSVRRCVPINAHFELTHNCNLKCVHCYIVKDNARAELTYFEIRDLLDQLADAGCLWLTLSGGEVLARNDFFDIAFYAKTKHFALRILTNGTLIDKTAADKIAELAPVAVDISLHGATARTHDAITQTNGSFAQTSRAIELLDALNIRVILKTTLMKPNIHELEAVFRLSQDLGLEHQFDMQICPKDNGSLTPTRHQLDRDQLLEYLLTDIPKTVDYVEEEPISAARQASTCSPATNSCAISAYGDVRPCSILPLCLGNIREERFLKIWHSSNPELRKLRQVRQYQDLRPCSHCDLVFHCRRCHGLAQLFEGDFLACDPLAFKVAEVTKKVNNIRRTEMSWKTTVPSRRDAIISLN